MKFTVRTVCWSDDASNTDKQYRTFAADNGIEIRQNSRIGALGQFQWFDRGTGIAARREANAQIQSKIKRGYRDGEATTEFDYPDNKVPQDKNAARHLAQAFAASGLPGSSPGALVNASKGQPVAVARPVNSTTAPVFGLEELLEEIMAGINAAIKNRDDGTTALLDLRPKIAAETERLAQVQSYVETLEDLVMA